MSGEIDWDELCNTLGWVDVPRHIPGLVVSATASFNRPVRWQELLAYQFRDKNLRDKKRIWV